FSALVIYLSLVALARDPGLWLALYNSKNLLFAKTDFFPPFTNEAWKQLAALRDPQVDELARKLQECCNPLWVSNRSLEATLEQPAASVLPPVPDGQAWWQQRPAPGAGTPAQGAPASASPSRAWPQSAPSPGPAASPGPAVPGPAAPATRTQTGPAVGAVALALGVLLLVIGAASHIGVVVIGGLVLGAWGMWRLVTATGRGGKPPG